MPLRRLWVLYYKLKYKHQVMVKMILRKCGMWAPCTVFLKTACRYWSVWDLFVGLSRFLCRPQKSRRDNRSRTQFELFLAISDWRLFQKRKIRSFLLLENTGSRKQLLMRERVGSAQTTVEWWLHISIKNRGAYFHYFRCRAQACFIS